MLRCRLSTVGTVVGGRDGIQWITCRRASCLSLKFAQPAPRLSVAQAGSRLQLFEAVAALPSSDMELWNVPPAEGTPSMTQCLEPMTAVSSASRCDSTASDNTVAALATRSPSSSSGKHEAARVRQPEAAVTTRSSVPILRSFLSQTSPSVSPSQSASSVQSLYTYVKSRSQLGALSSKDMSCLISLFGSMAILTAPGSSPAGSFMHPLAPTMKGGDPHHHWSFVISLVQDKEDLGRSLSDSDRYWVMRASLAELHKVKTVEDDADELNRRTRLLSRARVHYHHLARHSRSPDAHAAYLDALLKYGDSSSFDNFAFSFAKSLRRLEWVSGVHRDLIQRIILSRGSELSPRSKRQILSVISHWSRRPSKVMFNAFCNGGLSENSSSTDVTILHLLSAILGLIFPSRPPSDSSRFSSSNQKLLQWCKAEAIARLSPGPTAQSLASAWRNLMLLVFVDASPELLKSFSHAPPALGNTQDGSQATHWEVICALRTMERAYSLGEDVDNDAKDILQTLWYHWSGRTRLGDDIPSSVIHAILASFMQLSGVVKDPYLTEGVFRFYVSEVFRAPDGSGDVSLPCTVDAVLIEYSTAMARCGAKTWDIALANLRKLRIEGSALSKIASKALVRLTQIDLSDSYSLYFHSARAGLQLEPDATLILGKVLASQGFFELALGLLSQPTLSLAQARAILDAVLSGISSRQLRRIPKGAALSLGTACSRLYMSDPPSRSSHVAFALLLLARNGRSLDAYRTFQGIRGAAPSYFGSRFLTQFLRTLLQHRQFRLATRLYRSLYDKNTTVGLTLRATLLLGLWRGGATNLALQVRKTSNSTSNRAPRFVSLVQSGRLERRSSRVTSLKLVEALTEKKTISFSEARQLLDLLIYAGRRKAAWKWFQGLQQRETSGQYMALGNMLLHGELFRRNCRNARQVQQVLASLTRLVREYGFIPDRVTVNILVKAILGWKRAISSQHVQALFDTLLESGYPAGTHVLRAGTVFGTERSLFRPGHLLPKVTSRISFRRHVRPLYKMFIKAFHVRGDQRSARIVVGILKDVEKRWYEEVEMRARARRRGVLRMLERRRKVDGGNETS